MISSRFGKVFTVPEAYIVQDTAKIADLQDPSIKMSKSASSPNGIIELLEERGWKGRTRIEQVPAHRLAAGLGDRSTSVSEKHVG